MKASFVLLSFAGLMLVQALAAPAEVAQAVEDTHVITDTSSALIEEPTRVKKSVEQGSNPKTVCFKAAGREGIFLIIFRNS